MSSTTPELAEELLSKLGIPHDNVREVTIHMAWEEYTEITVVYFANPRVHFELTERTYKVIEITDPPPESESDDDYYDI